VEFPEEIPTPPPSAAARLNADIRRWADMPKGGQFAAREHAATENRTEAKTLRSLHEIFAV
jgi:hypothetical protein